MRRARAVVEDGSLELLLDTICNTFGGVIFISLLLSLIIDSSGGMARPESKPVRSAADLVEAETRREGSAAELLRLRVATESAISISETLVTDEAIAVAEELADWEAKHAALVERKSAAIGSINRDRIAMEQATEEAEAVEAAREEAAAKRDELSKKEAEIRAAAADAVAERSRNAQAPKLEYRPDLVQVDFSLQQGRLYGPLFYPAGGRNEVDYEFPERDGTTYIETRPNAGLRVAADGSNIEAVAEKLLVGAPERYAIHLHVMPDSYRQYDAVRIALEKQAFRSAVVPWPDDAVFVLGKAEERKTQ
jgi:hypothetical protein